MALELWTGARPPMLMFWDFFLWVKEKPSNIFEQGKVSVPGLSPLRKLILLSKQLYGIVLYPFPVEQTGSVFQS